MSDDLSMLPADVRGALAEIAGEAVCTCSVEYTSRGLKDPQCNHDLAESVETIRAELLRLTRENAELHESAIGGYEDGWHALRNERDALKAELAKLKARIAEAPVATLSRGNGDLLVAVSAENPGDWAGKTARLLVEDEG